MPPLILTNLLTFFDSRLLLSGCAESHSTYAIYLCVKEIDAGTGLL
jgi:hypothetical protein